MLQTALSLYPQQVPLAKSILPSRHRLRSLNLQPVAGLAHLQILQLQILALRKCHRSRHLVYQTVVSLGHLFLGVALVVDSVLERS